MTKFIANKIKVFVIMQNDKGCSLNEICKQSKFCAIPKTEILELLNELIQSNVICLQNDRYFRVKVKRVRNKRQIKLNFEL